MQQKNYGTFSFTELEECLDKVLENSQQERSQKVEEIQNSISSSFPYEIPQANSAIKITYSLDIDSYYAFYNNIDTDNTLKSKLPNEFQEILQNKGMQIKFIIEEYFNKLRKAFDTECSNGFSLLKALLSHYSDTGIKVLFGFYERIDDWQLVAAYSHDKDSVIIKLDTAREKLLYDDRKEKHLIGAVIHELLHKLDGKKSQIIHGVYNSVVGENVQDINTVRNLLLDAIQASKLVLYQPIISDGYAIKFCEAIQSANDIKTMQKEFYRFIGEIFPNIVSFIHENEAQKALDALINKAKQSHPWIDSIRNHITLAENAINYKKCESAKALLNQILKQAGSISDFLTKN